LASLAAKSGLMLVYAACVLNLGVLSADEKVRLVESLRSLLAATRSAVAGADRS
jgi:hypothetical protein